MLKKKNLFYFQNQIILTNGSTIQNSSVKYIKNYELNHTTFSIINTQEFCNNINKNIIQQKNINNLYLFKKKN